jgi:hypothetical protein
MAKLLKQLYPHVPGCPECWVVSVYYLTLNRAIEDCVLMHLRECIVYGIAMESAPTERYELFKEVG